MLSCNLPHCPSVVSLGPPPVSIIALSAVRSHTLSGDLLPLSASTSWSLFLEDVKGNFQLTFFWIFWKLLGLKAPFPSQQSCWLQHHCVPRALKHRLQTHPSVLSEARLYMTQSAPLFSSLLKPVCFWLSPTFLLNPPTSLSLYHPLICQGSLMGPHIVLSGALNTLAQ